MRSTSNLHFRRWQWGIKKDSIFLLSHSVRVLAVTSWLMISCWHGRFRERTDTDVQCGEWGRPLSSWSDAAWGLDLAYILLATVTKNSFWIRDFHDNGRTTPHSRWTHPRSYVEHPPCFRWWQEPKSHSCLSASENASHTCYLDDCRS